VDCRAGGRIFGTSPIHSWHGGYASWPGHSFRLGLLVLWWRVDRVGFPGFLASAAERVASAGPFSLFFLGGEIQTFHGLVVRVGFSLDGRPGCPGFGLLVTDPVAVSGTVDGRSARD